MIGKNKGDKSPLYGKKGATSGVKLSEDRKQFLREVRNGDKNPMYDEKKYLWQNIKTGEVVTLTRYELCKTYNLHNSNVQLVLQGKQKRVKDWKLKQTK